MEHNELKRAMVRAAVHKGISDVCADPERGMRRLVDLGSHFAKGRFQREVYRVMQTQLTHSSGAYYRMVRSLIEHVRPQVLEDFGMNIGYNSWTHGAQLIRMREEAEGFNVPWCIVMDAGGSVDAGDVMTQGERMGIYSYVLFAGGAETLAQLYPVLHAHRECAVFLMMKTAELPQVNMENVTNVIPVMPMEAEGTPAALSVLQEKRCCCGVWTAYDEESARFVLSGEAERRAEELQAQLVFAVPSERAGSTVRAQVQAHAEDMRQHKQYVPMFIDLMGDMERIDRVISEDGCTLCIERDGVVRIRDGRMEGVSVKDMALKDVLRRVMKKKAFKGE